MCRREHTKYHLHSFSLEASEAKAAVARRRTGQQQKGHAARLKRVLMVINCLPIVAYAGRNKQTFFTCRVNEALGSRHPPGLRALSVRIRQVCHPVHFLLGASEDNHYHIVVRSNKRLGIVDGGQSFLRPLPPGGHEEFPSS